MANVLLLSESELRKCAPLDLAAVECIESAFAQLAGGAVIMPPVLRLDIAEHRGEVDVKTAYLPGLDSFAVKLSPGFFDNPKLGLPSLSGLMVVLSARTGRLEALLLDNGYLTAVRTAAAGAVAARWLARADAAHAAVIGAGEQARLQLQALTLVRTIRSATVWSPRPARAAEFAQQMQAQLGIQVRPCTDVAEALADADIAVTTTPSQRPLIEKRHLRAGLHITAMGADAEHKNEIHPDALAAVTHYVCDKLDQVRVLGELHHAIEAGRVAADEARDELGAVITRRCDGRVSDDDVTLCDLTGTGAQDTAIAELARARALRAGVGTRLDA